ncbi:MAG: hypothetical protein ACJAW8_002332 [Oleispira sp.]|jgi:hypothetical protein
MHVLHELSQFKALSENSTKSNAIKSSASRLADMCRHTRRVTRPGSTIYFISDWHDFDADCERQLHQISKHNDVVAINIFDAFEQNILPLGSYPLTDGEQHLQLECYSKFQGLEHQQAFERRQQTLKQRTLKLGIPLISLQAQDDIITTLRQGLGLSQIAMNKVSVSKIAESKGNK